MVATIKGHKDVVDMLLSKGADVNAKITDFGATALYLACQIGYKEIVESLISKGADINAEY